VNWWRSIFKKKVTLCDVCLDRPIAVFPAVIRLESLDGVVEMRTCDQCALFFTKSAEVLSSKKRAPIEEEDEYE
jgi:hypothetical protein